jgi:hypothetical protein
MFKEKICNDDACSGIFGYPKFVKLIGEQFNDGKPLEIHTNYLETISE